MSVKGNLVENDVLTGQLGVSTHAVSPTVQISKKGKVTTVNITDLYGTKTATINDGADGQPGADGYTPIKGKDYFTAEEKIQITNDTANAVKGRVNGSVVRAVDVSPALHHPYVKVSGKNLFNGELVSGYYQDADFAISANEAYRSIKIYLTAGTYTFSSSATLAIVRTVIDGVHDIPGAISNTRTFTALTDGYVGLSFRLEPSADWDDSVALQIEKGSTATAYTPYVDPADVTVDVCGKNVIRYPFHDTTKTVKGITFTDNGDGTITVNGTAEGPVSFLFVDGGTTYVDGEYTMSGIVGGAGDKYYIQPFVDGVSYRGLTDVSRTYDFAPGFLNRVMLYVYQGATIDNLKVSLMLEKGSCATEYEKYTGCIYGVSGDGVVENPLSQSPTMTIHTNNPVTIECEYNRDIGKVIDISYFGVPYSSATKNIDVSTAGDGSVKLYLFRNSNGMYDGVVRGNGAIRDYTEDNRPYPVEQISRLHIEYGITSIGAYFMYGAYALQNLSFEDSKAITHLGAYAFAKTLIGGEYDFSGLTDTEMQCAFMGCARLEGLTLSATIKTIKGNEAFCNCFALRYVKGLTGLTKITGEATFYNCTSLAEFDVNPANVTLDKTTFVHVPSSAVISGTTTPLYKANWGNIGTDCFVQNMWTDDQLSQIRATVGEKSSIFPVPCYDAQTDEFYHSYNLIWFVYTSKGNLEVIKGTAYQGGCGYFSLFHIYNAMHPDAQFRSFRDFVEKLILPRKITVTQDMHDKLDNDSYGELVVAANKNVPYEVGSEITAFDLPNKLSDQEYGGEYTSFWGVCKALGWTFTKTLSTDFEDGKSTLKKTLIENLSENKPVLITIHSRATNADGGHAVAVIGYDATVDKFLVVDSYDVLPSKHYAVTYRVDLEALTSPDTEDGHQDAYIMTFDFGEVVTLTDIDNKLDFLMASVNSGYHTESETFVMPDAAANTPIRIPFGTGAKLFFLEADEETTASIVGQDVTYTLGFYAVFSNVISERNAMPIFWHKAQYAYGSSAATNTDGITLSFTQAFKAGTYRCKAYYWNEVKEG